MRPIAFIATLVLLSSCTSDAPREEAAPADLEVTPADFAGIWNGTVLLDGVEDTVTVQIESTPDGSDWTLHVTDRDPIDLDVSVEDDSLITVSDPFESTLRDGQMVAARTAMVRQGDTMRGTVRLSYQSDEGEQVVYGTMHSTRVQ